MIKKRDAVGKLFTPSGNFMIIRGFDYIDIIGTEAKTKIDYSSDKEGLSDPLHYYPRPGILTIQGDYVYKEFPQPKEIYIYVEEENET